jgi:Flp pilus assembly protein TadB
MTVAPNASPTRRLVLTALCAVAFLVFGVLVMQSFGVGPAIFLFVLAAVCVVDAVQVQRRAARKRARA